MTPSVSVVVACHNRRAECLVAVESALAQDYEGLEILVLDDFSRDGTVEAVRERFPGVRVFASQEKRSAAVLRNWGFREAQGEYIFSLDDDSYFSDPGIISAITKCFLERPEVAVVGIPYIEPFDTSHHSIVKLVPGERIASYTGCAAALRRSAVLAVGGYRECYGYYGEEGDLAIRLRDRGYDLVQGDSGYVVHTKSPKRDMAIQTRLSIRNALFAIWFNLPIEHAILRSLVYPFGLLRYRFSISSLPVKCYCLVAGMWATVKHIGLRAPVRRDTYQTYRQLRSHGKQPWDGAPPLPCERRLFGG